MRLHDKTLLCVAVNLLGLLALVLFVVGSADLGDLLRWGPADDLVVLKIRVTTWSKYIGLVSAICLLKSLEVLVNDIGSPTLGFSIYDPNRTIVYGFTKDALGYLANTMWFINSFGNLLKTYVMIARFDVGLISMLASEMTQVVTVRYLLSQKTFIPEFDSEEERTAAAHVTIDVRDGDDEGVSLIPS